MSTDLEAAAERLRSVGFLENCVIHEDGGKTVISLGNGKMEYSVVCKTITVAHMLTLHKVTRGQLRGLCHFLGIELKEPS